MYKIEIQIRGPGLVVNTPVSLIYKVLVDAGYNVDLEQFSGQTTDKIKLVKNDSGQKIEIKVDPLPWGG